MYLDFRQKFRESKGRLALQTIVGIGLAACGAGLAATGAAENRHFVLYDGLILAIVGLSQLAVLIVSVIAEWYFKIDGESIDYCPQFGRGKQFRWADIANVEIAKGRVLLKLKDGRTERLNLNWFSYHDHLAIRNAVETAAREQHLLSGR